MDLHRALKRPIRTVSRNLLAQHGLELPPRLHDLSSLRSVFPGPTRIEANWVPCSSPCRNTSFTLSGRHPGNLALLIEHVTGQRVEGHELWVEVEKELDFLFRDGRALRSCAWKSWTSPEAPSPTASGGA